RSARAGVASAPAAATGPTSRTHRLVRRTARRRRWPRWSRSARSGIVVASSQPVDRSAGILGGFSQHFFDAEQLIVLGHALAARYRSRLDLARAGGHGEVGD